MFKMHLTPLYHSIILVLEWRFSDIFDSPNLIINLTVIDNLIGLTSCEMTNKWSNLEWQTWTNYCISIISNQLFENDSLFFYICINFIIVPFISYLFDLFFDAPRNTKQLLLDPLDMKEHSTFTLLHSIYILPLHIFQPCMLKCSHYITFYALSVMDFSFRRLSTKIFWFKRRWWSFEHG